MIKKTRKNPSELTEDEIDYLVKNSHFSKNELLEWHEGFKVDIENPL